MVKIAFLLLALHGLAVGGFEQTEAGARPASMGGAYIGLANDVWAIFYNVAGLSDLSSREVSFFYTPGQFGLSELTRSTLAIGFPTRLGVFGLAARRYGFDLYHEVTWTASYANRVSGLSVGVNLNYHTVSIQNYGSSGAVGIDVGVLLGFSRHVRWGVAAKNVNSPTIGESGEPLPQTFSAGIAYLPTQSLSLTLDYVKETNFDPSSRFGFEYRIIDAVALRGGVSDRPSEYAGGIGIQYGIVAIDYAFFMHQELGITHQGSILIRW
jgi:hypothetical protein